ncbi:imidazole glycerol phosphate synthase subunit HisH [bacterium]|nr:imidazole glycerol phosphate synthase subunit HisH [bacterium]
MKAVIIDYGSGNLRSAQKACERVAPAGMQIAISSDVNTVQKADYIVLPGVGAFGDCIAGLKAIPDMEASLNNAVKKEAKPFLGICVGMQLLAKEGHEHGIHQGLGWIDAIVEPIPPAPGIKIPHMGWNNLNIQLPHPLLAGIHTGDHAYFVHSYHMTGSNGALPPHCLATVQHGKNLTAIVGRDNWLGTQFHPEKSQATGLKLLENFLRWKP